MNVGDIKNAAGVIKPSGTSGKLTSTASLPGKGGLFKVTLPTMIENGLFDGDKFRREAELLKKGK